jgi:hypothetical protein
VRPTVLFSVCVGSVLCVLRSVAGGGCSSVSVCWVPGYPHINEQMRHICCVSVLWYVLFIIIIIINIIVFMFIFTHAGMVYGMYMPNNIFTQGPLPLPGPSWCPPSPRPGARGDIICLHRETEEKARQPETKLGAIAQTRHIARLRNAEQSRTKHPKPTHGARDRPKQPQPRAGRDRTSALAS